MGRPRKEALGASGVSALKKAVKGGRTMPHLSELAEQFIAVSGGPRELARMLYEEWTASKPGTLVRTRILDLMSRVWRYASDRMGHTDDLGILSDADLSREMDLILESQAARSAEAAEESEADGEEAADQNP